MCARGGITLNGSLENGSLGSGRRERERRKERKKGLLSSLSLSLSLKRSEEGGERRNECSVDDFNKEEGNRIQRERRKKLAARTEKKENVLSIDAVFTAHIVTFDFFSLPAACATMAAAAAAAAAEEKRKRMGWERC